MTATLGATGKVRAQGAGLTVPVTITCSGLGGGMRVSIERRVRQGPIGDGGGAQAICDATRRTVTVPVDASSSEVAFAPGAAFALATVTACDLAGRCEPVQPMRTIQIVR